MLHTDFPHRLFSVVPEQECSRSLRGRTREDFQIVPGACWCAARPSRGRSNQRHVKHELYAWNKSSNHWFVFLIVISPPPSLRRRSANYRALTKRAWVQLCFGFNETVCRLKLEGCRTLVKRAVRRLGKNKLGRMSEVGWLQSGSEGFWMWKSGRQGTGEGGCREEGMPERMRRGLGKQSCDRAGWVGWIWAGAAHVDPEAPLWQNTTGSTEEQNRLHALLGLGIGLNYSPFLSRRKSALIRFQ